MYGVGSYLCTPLLKSGQKSARQYEFFSSFNLFLSSNKKLGFEKRFGGVKNASTFALPIENGLFWRGVLRG